MSDTKRVREIPDYHLLPDYVTEDLVSSLGAAGLLPHYNNDGATVTAAAATDLATSKTLAKDIADVLVAHGADTGIHSSADATLEFAAEYTSSPELPADLTEVEAILNQAKALFNTHLANATVHRGVGGAAGITVGTISTANATDQSTSNALANALKAAINRHAAMGFAPFAVD